jgi:hypothetical protein
MHCEEYQVEIMVKQGPVDGSGPRSIREAFNRFLFTPLITAEDFKDHPHEVPEYESGVKVIEEVVCSPEEEGCHYEKPHHPVHYPEPHHPEPHHPVDDQTYAQA